MLFLLACAGPVDPADSGETFIDDSGSTRRDGWPMPLPSCSLAAPGGPAVPLLGIAVVVWLLSHTTAPEARGTLLVVAASVAYYLLRQPAETSQALAEAAERGHRTAPRRSARRPGRHQGGGRGGAADLDPSAGVLR